MEQHRKLDIPIGTTLRSAARAPIDGNYELVEHIASSDCSPSAEERKLYLLRGELVPPCRRCGKRGIWKLTESWFEIPPERNQTPFVLKEIRGDRPDLPYPSGTRQ